MNIYLDMLATDQTALRRIRDLVAGEARPAEDYVDDVDLVTQEIQRVLARLRHWEEVVDRLRPGGPTRLK